MGDQELLLESANSRHICRSFPTALLLPLTQGTGVVRDPGIDCLSPPTLILPPHFPPYFPQGTGMVGVPGIASAIFSTVRDANINVVMISQVDLGFGVWGLAIFRARRIWPCF